MEFTLKINNKFFIFGLYFIINLFKKSEVIVDQSDSCIINATSDKRSANYFEIYPVNDITKGTFDMKTKTISFEGQNSNMEMNI